MTSYITSQQMAQVDKLAMQKYNIDILQMMENAGRNLANFTAKLNPNHVFIFFGKGNNGGGGLVAARHLAIKGFKVQIIAASKKVNKTVRKQLSILRKMGILESTKIKAKKGDLIIDALLGYNIKGNPVGKFADIINSINSAQKTGIKVVSLDIPSGLDPNTGTPNNPTVNANYTLTLALPKTGLKKIKNVYLVNIGIPNEVYINLKIPIKNYFKNKDIIKLRTSAP